MRVSVIVPAFNEERILAETLGHIRTAAQAFESRDWEWELIVCDNNSTDRTAEIARAAGAQVVFEPVNQIARARNAGAAQASGDWLLFVDADSHPTRDLLADVAEEIAGGRTLAGGSTVRFDRPHPAVRIAGWIWNTISLVKRWAAGSFIFCDAEAFRTVGGFSEALYAGEEIDLFRRLKRLARRRRKHIRILRRHPLLTSDRKARLYSPGEVRRFYLRTILKGGRNLRSADEAFLWYDGRR